MYNVNFKTCANPTIIHGKDMETGRVYIVTYSGYGSRIENGEPVVRVGDYIASLTSRKFTGIECVNVRELSPKETIIITG